MSKNASIIIVKNCKNDNSVTHTHQQKLVNVDVSQSGFSFSLCFHSHYFRDLALYEVFLQSELFLFDFLIPSQLKHLVVRAFLAGNLPKKLSKLGVLDERGMKK